MLLNNWLRAGSEHYTAGKTIRHHCKSAELI